MVVWLLLPLYFRGELFTAYEVLDRRFGGATKRVASLVFLVTRNLGDGLRLFLTAIVVQHVLGWDLTPSIVLSGAVTIVYTLLWRHEVGRMERLHPVRHLHRRRRAGRIRDRLGPAGRLDAVGRVRSRSTTSFACSISPFDVDRRHDDVLDPD